MQKTKGELYLPPFGAPEAELLDLQEKWFNDDATFRTYVLEGMAQSLHYTLGNQWIELDKRLISRTGNSTFKFTERDAGARYPKPITNLISPAVEVEMASLAKRELVPTVLTTSKDPRIQAAARVAKEILNYRLKTIHWQSKRELCTYLAIVTGTGILKSYWDEPNSDQTYISNPDATICPECGTMSSSRTIQEADVLPFGIKHTEMLRTAPEQTPGADTNLQMNYCPTCDEQVEMVPFDMTTEDAQGQDFMGRPLGRPVPKGNTDIEVVSPFDFFPENSGIGVTPEDMRYFGQATVRPVEWVCERYPLAEIDPEDGKELMENHPLLGEYKFWGNFNPGYDGNVYGNHVRLYEFYADKGYLFPEGRALVFANNKVISDGPLYRTVKGVSVPIVQYHAARFKVRHGIFWGQGLVENLISPQNRLNGMDSQIIDARERTGSPNLIIPEAAGVDGPEFFEEDYGSGKVMYYKTDPLNPNAKPEVFGSILFPDGVYNERNNVKEDMREIAGPQDIELGEAPRNITTTSGLQLLGEQAERRRGSRERALVDMFQRIWEHQLRLIWTLRVDSDEYEVQTEEGLWERKQYNRMSILGQTRVKIEKQAYVDKSLIVKEGVREAMAEGLYKLDSPVAIKKILELRDLPTDVNQFQNDQVDAAMRQWIDFKDEGKMPFIDPAVDDEPIHYAVLSEGLGSEEGILYTEKVGYPSIVKHLSLWEDDLAQAEMMDQQVRSMYGSEKPQPELDKMYAKFMASYVIQKQVWEKQQQTAPPAEAIAAGLPMAQPAPQEPPPPVFLPRAKEDRIMGIWLQLLFNKGFAPEEQVAQAEAANQAAMLVGMQGQPVPQPIAKELMEYLKFRAIVEAYKLITKEEAMKGVAGLPNVPPGGPAVPQAGSVPTSPQGNSTGPTQPPSPPDIPDIGQ